MSDHTESLPFKPDLKKQEKDIPERLPKSTGKKTLNFGFFWVLFK